MVKIGLYIMGLKGLKVLKSIIENSNDSVLAFVVGSKDENIQNDYYDEIKTLSVKQNFIFYDRIDSKNLPFHNYLIAIGWRWIINTDKKLIVLHDSLLPKYRGFNPLVTALINGDKEVGVTALFATENYDEGDIILQKSMQIVYPIKINEAIEKISLLYSQIVNEIIFNLISVGELLSYPQIHSAATFSLWRDEEDYHIDWNKDAKYLERFINSVSFPYNGAYSIVENEKIRITEAEAIENVEIENRTPGKVIFFNNNIPTVVCGYGLLKLKKMSRNNGDNYILKKFRTRFK